MKKLITIILLCLLFCLSPLKIEGRRYILKTNIISDIFLSPNINFEMGIVPNFSINVGTELNAWDINYHRWKHWMIQPELRYWFWNEYRVPLTGHFLGLHFIGGTYNWANLDIPFSFLGTDFKQLKDYRFKGFFTGIGIGYGYSWIIGKNLNIEAELGIGWIHTSYDKYKCVDCGKKLNDEKLDHEYFGPTKIAINIGYNF